MIYPVVIEAYKGGKLVTRGTISEIVRKTNITKRNVYLAIDERRPCKGYTLKQTKRMMLQYIARSDDMIVTGSADELAIYFKTCPANVHRAQRKGKSRCGIFKNFTVTRKWVEV